MVELTDLEGALPTDAKVRVTAEWELPTGNSSNAKQLRLQALDSMAWERFQMAAAANKCDDAPRQRTKRSRLDAHLTNIGDPDSVDYRCAITFFDMGAGFNPEDPTDGRWGRLFPNAHFPATWRKGSGCIFRLTPHDAIFDASGNVLGGAVEVEYVLKANLVLQMQEQFRESRGAGFRTRVPDPDRPGRDMWTPYVEFPLGYKNPLTGHPFSEQLYEECLTPLIVEAAAAGPDGRPGVMTLAGGFVDTPASGAPSTMRARQIILNAMGSLGNEEMADQILQLTTTHGVDAMRAMVQQILDEQTAREAAAAAAARPAPELRREPARVLAAPPGRGALDRTQYLREAGTFERNSMQQPPRSDPSNPAPALVPVTRTNISAAPLRLVDVGSVRVDEFAAMGILGPAWERWRDTPNRPPVEPRNWRSAAEFEYTYPARGLNPQHWYNESADANRVADELMEERNAQYRLTGGAPPGWYNRHPLLMPWPPERGLSVESLLTRHLARWTLRSANADPGGTSHVPPSGLSGVLTPPGAEAYGDEQSRSIVLRAPDQDDFGAFLRGKIQRSVSIAAARAEVFDDAGLSQEARAALERQFERHMPLTAESERAVGEPEIRAIVDELLDADAAGQEVPYERGSASLFPGHGQPERVMSDATVHKLRTQGRAQQLLVTVVWEDGDAYEPMMHAGWYRTGPVPDALRRDGPSWRYSLPCHRVYVRFLPAHAAPMNLAEGRAQTSDLEVPMLVNLPTNLEAEAIDRAFASSTPPPLGPGQAFPALDAAQSSALREDRANLAFAAQLEEAYWTETGVNMETGNGLMRHVRRGGRDPNEEVVLWGHPRRSRAEPLTMYNRMPTYDDDDGSVAELGPNTHCPRCPTLYPSPLSSAARDGLIFDMGDQEVLVSTARLVLPNQLDAFEQRRPISISLAAREMGALMLGQLLRPGRSGSPGDRDPLALRQGPLLAAIHKSGPTVGQAGQPLRFDPALVEDPWFLEVHPEITDHNGEAVHGKRMFKAGMRLVLSTSTVQANAARKLAQLLLDRHRAAERWRAVAGLDAGRDPDAPEPPPTPSSDLDEDEHDYGADMTHNVHDIGP